MPTKSRLITVTNLALVASTACLVTACNKSSSASTPGAAATNAAGSAAVSAPAGASAAIAAATGKGGPLDSSKQCAAIKPADVQALMKAPAAAVQDFPGECSFYGGDLKIDIYPNDPTQKYYQNPVNGPGTTPLSGVGDQAQWYAPVPGGTTPWIEAHKGSLTCVVSPADVAETTIPYTGSDPFFKIAPADSAAYAAKEGVLCNDIFSAS